MWFSAWIGYLAIEPHYIVIKRKKSKLEVKFRGISIELPSSIISAMAAQRMLCKGCQGYLAYVVEIGKEETLVDEIPVVRNLVEEIGKGPLSPRRT